MSHSFSYGRKKSIVLLFSSLSSQLKTAVVAAVSRPLLQGPIESAAASEPGTGATQYFGANPELALHPGALPPASATTPFQQQGRHIPLRRS